MKNDELKSLRRNDFKISLVLLIICAFLFWETSDYPMDGTFGGVDNKWYVSPALFPLILISLISLSCIYLLLKSYSYIDFKSIVRLSFWLGKFDSVVDKNRWYVILILSLYVYFYVPSGDFYLATVVFLLSLFSGFYTDNNALIKAGFIVNIFIFISVLISRFFICEDFYFISLDASYDESFIFASDTIMSISILLLFFILVSSGVNRVKKRNIIIVSLIVPLVLVFIFNFLLQVPMPVEYGSVIKGMEYIWYDVLNL